jgi:hypothetical protein
MCTLTSAKYDLDGTLLELPGGTVVPVVRREQHWIRELIIGAQSLTIAITGLTLCLSNNLGDKVIAYFHTKEQVLSMVYDLVPEAEIVQ